MAETKITDRDNGYRRMLANIEKAGAYKVTVGVHQEEGSATTDSGRSLAEVAEANEYGIGVPARPAITGWAADNENIVPQHIRDEHAAALGAGADPIQRVDALAQRFAGEIQQDISAGIPPENAESTIARKGSSTPLIDSGQFRASIRGKVRPA